MRGIRPPLLGSALLSLFWERGTGKVSNINVLMEVTSGSSQPSADIFFLCVCVCSMTVGNFEKWEKLVSGVSFPSPENFTL